MATTEGPLVLADISGYAKFIEATELEHSDVPGRRAPPVARQASGPR